MQNEVLEYINLKLDKLPKELSFKKPDYVVTKAYDNDNQYRVYKRIAIKDVAILLSDSDRTTELKTRFDEALPLNEYIKKNEGKLEELAEKCSVKEIEKLEKLQKELKDKTPYFIKYDKNYLWQIYYSITDDKYFMLFPTKEGETAVLFYMIKMMLEAPDTLIYVPICKEDYSGKIMASKEISDIENYIWISTRYWPQLYEVDEKELYVVGEVTLQENIKSKYRIKLESDIEAAKFYTALKAMFILTTETNYEYVFSPAIDNNGALYFCYKNEPITIENLESFITTQTKTRLELKKRINDLIETQKQKLEDLKKDIEEKEKTYQGQKKEIEQYLQCRDSMFKKIKFYFSKRKTGKEKFKLKDKDKKNLEKQKEGTENLDELDLKTLLAESYDFAVKELETSSEKYTVSDFIKTYTETKEILEKEHENEEDIRALVVKQTNLGSKIKNAKQYIDEIDKHRVSIFDFFRFAGKNNLIGLGQGTEVHETPTKIKHVFEFDTDIQELSNRADESIREHLSQEEINSLYVSKYILGSLNSIVTKSDTWVIDEQYEELKEKYDSREEKDFFGEIRDDYTVLKTLNNKRHRENKKELYKVLGFNQNTTLDEYKEKLRYYADLLNDAYSKITSIYDMSVYYAKKSKGYIHANINPTGLFKDKSITKLYKAYVTEESNILYYTNIVFYDNYNDTLPLGMDDSTSVLIKVGSNKKIGEQNINVIVEKDMFEVDIRHIKIIEEE